MGEVVKGDYFDAYPIRIVEGDAPLDLTGATVKMVFRANTRGGTIAYTAISSGISPTITITDAEEGMFQLEGFILDWRPDMYYFDCLVTIDGRPKTKFSGILRVLISAS
jgi:hypothetical protein